MANFKGMARVLCVKELLIASGKIWKWALKKRGESSRGDGSFFINEDKNHVKVKFSHLVMFF